MDLRSKLQRQGQGLVKLVLEDKDKDFPRGQHWVTVKNGLLADISIDISK